MKKKINTNGLALLELIIALIVLSIVMTAVVTLAYAMDTANDITDNTSRMQAQIRFAALRISDLIRHSRLVCCANSDDLAIWRADDDGDGQISISELVYIECGSNQEHLRICEFPSSNNTPINLNSIGPFATNWWSTYSADVDYMNLMPECNSVQFGFDVLPPQSGFVTISFDVVENSITRQCQINATLRCRAANLLDESNNIVSDDD